MRETHPFARALDSGASLHLEIFVHGGLAP
jgi:hypothetical protein